MATHAPITSTAPTRRAALDVAPGRRPLDPTPVIRPTRAQQRAAYRAIGAPIPANLRGLIGRAFA